MIKRRSRVLRRRTRQAALDKPRVRDRQWGFAILEQKAAETAKNRAFEEKQPLVFLPKYSPGQKRRECKKTLLLCELNEAETEVEYPVFARNRSKIFRFCAQFVAILMNFG